jgi:hypothetical protein
MELKNLWGELPKLDKTKTPVQILKEQAGQLTKLTNGVLVGAIDPVSSTHWEFGYMLSIRAPALNNYRYDVLLVTHSIALYPVAIRNPGAASLIKCQTEADYIAGLEKILTSESVRKIISALLIQSHATSPRAVE